MGRIRDLINSFLNPSESSKTFDELALATGMKPESIKELKATQNGVKWTGYSEIQETNPKRSPRGRQSVERTKQITSKQREENDRGIER